MYQEALQSLARPRPLVAEVGRLTLSGVRDWSGRGVDPQRDLDELWAGDPTTEVDYVGEQVWLSVVRNLRGRLFLDGACVESFDMGLLRLRVRLHRWVIPDTEPQQVWMYIGWYRIEDLDGNAAACNEHVVGSDWCLGEGTETVNWAVREGRWGDMFDAMESVATTFRDGAYYEAMRDRFSRQKARFRIPETEEAVR